MREQQGNSMQWRLWYPLEWADSAWIPESNDVDAVPLPYRSRWVNLLWHRFGVPLKIERYTGSVDVVHGTDFVVPPSSAPSVVTIHDLSYAILPELAFPRLKRYLETAVPRSLDRARKVIAVSETTKRDLCEYYEISPNRVNVIHHAADPLFHQPYRSEILAMQAQFGLKRPYFIMVGTIEPRKDHLSLLRAFERVHQSHPEASLVIVGKKGWLADDIMAAISKAAETMPVIHLQGIRDEMLPALYAGSTALVYPSLYEGFGLPLLEAMASGTAVISSNTDALVEVAGDAALYAPVQDSTKLADQMLSILEDETKRREYIEAGLARASSFSWTVAASQHIDIYRELAGV